MARRRTTRSVRMPLYAVAGGVLGGTTLGSVAAATYVARRVLTPDASRPDDVEILSVTGDLVTLRANEYTLSPGLCGFWLDRGDGHIRVGGIAGRDDGIVARPLLHVDGGRAHAGAARFNSYWYWSDPTTCLGVPHEDVDVRSDAGALPTWLIRPDRPTGRWAILMHGRGGSREETLRAVAPLRDAGLTILIPMYRNDIGAPRSRDGRYNLGLSEWRDLDAAMAYAVDHDATSLVIGGWSMGAAITLQALALSRYADRVAGVFFDSPVVDWADVLRYQAKLNHVPPVIRDLARHVMGRRRTRRLAGVHEPVDIALTNWVARSDELRHPILLIHSHDDDFVPIGPSLELAARRPDLVQLEQWRSAKHCMEWNTEPERWERLVGDFAQAVE